MFPSSVTRSGDRPPSTICVNRTHGLGALAWRKRAEGAATSRPNPRCTRGGGGHAQKLSVRPRTRSAEPIGPCAGSAGSSSEDQCCRPSARPLNTFIRLDNTTRIYSNIRGLYAPPTEALSRQPGKSLNAAYPDKHPLASLPISLCVGSPKPKAEPQRKRDPQVSRGRDSLGRGGHMLAVFIVTVFTDAPLMTNKCRPYTGVSWRGPSFHAGPETRDTTAEGVVAKPIGPRLSVPCGATPWRQPPPRECEVSL